MFTVWMTDDLCCDDVMVFSGTLDACLAYVSDADDCYIVQPDGFTVYGN